MKNAALLVALTLTTTVISTMSCAQTTEQEIASSTSKTTKLMSVNTTALSNATVKQAIEALQTGDAAAWQSLFVDNATMLDDGNKIDFKNFTKNAIGHERFVSIDKVENNGLDVYGKFHSDQWGDFKTYFKFHISTEGKIDKLEIGQASY